MSNALPALTDADLTAIERGIDAGNLTHAQVHQLIAEARRLNAELHTLRERATILELSTENGTEIMRQNAVLTAQMRIALDYLDAIIYAYQTNDGIGRLLIAILQAKEWRGVNEKPKTAQDASGAIKST